MIAGSGITGMGKSVFTTRSNALLEPSGMVINAKPVATAIAAIMRM